MDNRYKFTGLERDSESGLDHTLFRMHASNLGRWLTPDPIAGSIINPQSLNRYAYVLNNPTNFIDPLGLDECQSSRDPQKCRDQYKPAETTRSGSPYNVGDSAQCIVDRAPVPCSMFFNMINAGWIHGAESARIINGVLVLEGGWIDRENGRVGIWTTLIPLSFNLVSVVKDLISRVPIGGSGFLPLLPVGAGAVGALGTVAVVPSQRLGCVGGGVGAAFPLTKGVSVGPLIHGNLTNAQSILRGWSLSVTFQPSAVVGYQVVANPSGVLGGPTVGTPGVSFGYTTSACTGGVQ